MASEIASLFLHVCVVLDIRFSLFVCFIIPLQLQLFQLSPNPTSTQSVTKHYCQNIPQCICGHVVTHVGTCFVAEHVLVNQRFHFLRARVDDFRHAIELFQMEYLSG